MAVSGAEDASALADAILSRLDSLDAASVSLWPRWKEVAVSPQRAVGAQPARRPLSALDGSRANRRANRPRSAVAAAGSNETLNKKAKRKKPAARRCRRPQAASAGDHPSQAAPQSPPTFPESFATAVDQLRARVGQLSAHLDYGVSASGTASETVPGMPPLNGRSSRAPLGTSGPSRRRARSASPARRRGRVAAAASRSVTPSPARQRDTRGATTLDRMLRTDQRDLRRAVEQSRAGTAAFALPVGKQTDSKRSATALTLSNRSQERFGELSLSNGSVGGRLFRALAVIEDLKRQRDADRCSIRHLQRALEFEKEKVAAYKEKANRASRLQRQLEQARTSLEHAARIREEQAEILAMSRPAVV